MKSPESHLTRTPDTRPNDREALPETPADLKKAITALEHGRPLDDIPTDELRKLNALYEKLDTLVSPKLPTLSATYRHTQEDGTTTPDKAIELSLESSLSSFESFYAQHHLTLSPEFRKTMEDIWNRNKADMEKAIEQYGFDTLLLVPGGTTLPELHQKMTEGYTATYEGVLLSSITENPSKDRIILVHKAQVLDDHPALKQTLNASAEELIENGETLTLSDYLIFQRKYFDETGQHLDDWGTKNQWTWLPGSKSGTRVVSARWHPGAGLLDVGAYRLSYRNPDRGCRLSRCFV